MLTIQKILAVALLFVSFSAYAAESGDALGDLTPLNHGALNDFAGGTAVVDNASTITSTVSQNTMGNVGYTGDISNSALTGNSGLTTLIANSGNQVSISQSTIVNVFLH